LHLSLRSGGRSGDRVLETHSLVVGYRDDGKPLFQAPNLLLWRGECAALIGPNGAGKTTFLRTLLGQLPPLAGRVKLGASLQVGYFAQAHESLQPERSLLEEIWSVQDMPIGPARDYLARFLFTGDDVFKKVQVLSGGERGRLALAKLALQGANFLLLDEPTNHLDIPSQEILEAVLADFEGTILLVSHDRYLIDALATQIWSLEEGRLTVFKGNYGEWAKDKEARELDEKRAGLAELRPAPASRAKAQTSGRRGAARSKPQANQAAQRRTAELETVIASLEQRLNEIGAELETAGASVDSVRVLGAEYAQVEADLNARIAEWERLAAGG
jgi:ATP-binding cassette subfamily F protein 3